jgi:hypothetical protein
MIVANGARVGVIVSYHLVMSLDVGEACATDTHISPLMASDDSLV